MAASRSSSARKPWAPPCNTAIAIFLAKNWLGMADRPETVVNMVQHAGPGQIVFNEEIKKKLVDMAVYIRKEALAEQQRLERFGNQPNGSCRVGHSFRKGLVPSH